MTYIDEQSTNLLIGVTLRVVNASVLNYQTNHSVIKPLSCSKENVISYGFVRCIHVCMLEHFKLINASCFAS